MSFSQICKIQVLEWHKRRKAQVWQYPEWSEHFVGIEQQ